MNQSNPAIVPAPAHIQAQPAGMFMGRISRLGYLIGVVYAILPLVATTVAFSVVQFLSSQAQPSSTDMLFGQSPGPLASIISILLFIVSAATIIFIIPASISLHIRRWHDLNRSGWYTVLSFVPLASIIAFVFIVFAPGTVGPNQFGEPFTPPYLPKKVLLGR